MGENALKTIRLSNLRRLVEYYGKQKVLADKIDMAPAQVSGLVTGRRGIGEELARKIEDKLGLDKRWLDGGDLPKIEINEQKNLKPDRRDIRDRIERMPPAWLEEVRLALDIVERRNRGKASPAKAEKKKI